LFSTFACSSIAFIVMVMDLGYGIWDAGILESWIPLSGHSCFNAALKPLQICISTTIPPGPDSANCYSKTISHKMQQQAKAN